MGKADNDALVQMMVSAAMPMIVAKLKGSAQYEALLKRVVETRAFVADAHKEIGDRLIQLDQDLRAFLSEHGLTEILADLEAQAAKGDIPAPVPAEGAGSQG